MNADLLDRPLGELTLRELTNLGKVAQAVSAAFASVTVATKDAPVRRLPAPRRRRVARSSTSSEVKKPATVADDIKAVVARKALPSAQNGQRTGPGKGRKLCPNPRCNLVLGAATRECTCGHKFEAVR